jgi:heme exporter protein C
VVWGVYWNWDPRQTSIFVLLLIYAALFALRSSIEDVARRRQLSAVYSLFAFVTMPFLIFVAPRISDSTLHPNCAFIQGSKCEGVELTAGTLGLLGDRKVELISLEQAGDVVTAKVEVTEPGLVSRATLSPSYDTASHKILDRPNFPGMRFRLVVEGVNLATNSAQLNIEAPGTGLIDNGRTLFTFLASIFGFTALFFWMMNVRATLLGVQWALARREGARI